MTAALDRCTAALGNANVRAFLRVIREDESTQTDEAYRMAHGGKLIDGPEHPWYGRTTTEVGHSTAYGAYQFLGTSWKEASDALGIGNDTSPINQDLCAVWTIADKRHALGPVMAGDVRLACYALRDEWVALQSMPLQRARRIFADYGGTLAAQTGAAIPPSPIPAPPEATESPQTPDLPPYRSQPETSMLPALLVPLLQQLINGFSPSGQTQLQPITGRPIDQLLPFAIDLFSKLAQTTGTLPAGQPVKTDAEAIAALAEYNKLKATNATLVSEIEAHALDYLDKVSPLIKEIHKMEVERKELSIKGKDAAQTRSRKDRWDMTKILVLSSEGLAWAIVLGGFSGVGAAIYVKEYQLALALLSVVASIVSVVLNNRKQAYDYRFDGTEQSEAIKISTDAVARALPTKP
jgi:muramidase (phage lysozyme)